MNGRRAIVGLSMLCALVLSAFAAPSAQALKGTTLFTCEKVDKGAEFSDEHCANKNGSGVGWIHSVIPEGTVTTTEATNEKTNGEKSTNSTIKSTIGGVAFEVVCTTVKSEGNLKNEQVENPPGSGKKQMMITGTATIKQTGCSVTKPVGSKCEVKGGEATGEAKVTSVVKEPAPGVEEMYEEYIGAKEKEGLFQFTLQKCEGKGPLDGVYTVTGRAIGTPNGATVEFIAGEPNSALKLEGNNAEYSGEETIRMKAGQPLSVTTTTT